MKICNDAANESDRVAPIARPFSVRLRENTRVAHEACEYAMDLAGALSGPFAYYRLLRRMQAVYIALASDYRLRDAEMLLGRPGSIAADLARLGHDLGGEFGNEGPVDSKPMTTEAEAIGSQYVLAGSRLGGRVIAKSILGQIPGARVTFFTGDDCDQSQTWRSFRNRLDELGRSSRYDYILVHQGAKRTFDLIGQALLGGLPWH